MTINPGLLPLLLMNCLCLFLRPSQLLMGWISPPFRDSGISLFDSICFISCLPCFCCCCSLLFSAGCKYGIKYLIWKNICPQPSTPLDILYFPIHYPSNKQTQKSLHDTFTCTVAEVVFLFSTKSPSWNHKNKQSLCRLVGNKWSSSRSASVSKNDAIHPIHGLVHNVSSIAFQKWVCGQFVSLWKIFVNWNR